MDTLIPLVNSLALAIALIGLIIGLCLAPWQFLLLLLVLGLIAAKRLMPPSSSPIATPDPETGSEPSVKPSQLSPPQASLEEPSSPSQPTSSASVMVYRGTRYKVPKKSEAVVEAPTVERTGKYRGTVCKISSRQPQPSPESHDLN